MPQQQVDAQAVPTAAATQASAVAQTAFRVFMPLVLKRQGIVSDLINVPSSPANAMYATEQWDLLTEIEINGQIEQRTIAFAEGYFADVATPSVFAGQNVSYIIIGFGRQIEPQVGDDRLWGVDLPADNGGYESMPWVAARAQEFIDGYAANPEHTETTIIAIGTSNFNVDWRCDNDGNINDPDFISLLWKEAGRIWGNLVTDLNERRGVIIRSGNDIESWTGTFPGWVACGKGTIAWFNGYQTTSDIPVVNFGSHAFAENNVDWTERELYRVTTGIENAVVLPQVYCDVEVYTTKWADFRSSYEIQFQGVTSDNQGGSEFCDGDPTLAWDVAWTTFDTTLTNAGYPNNVNPAVSSFVYMKQRLELDQQ
ncbi:MAG: hypothetical protein HC893_08895 [Chloroflexaceae bacterium]|nr:hypothetical protein [Chloroflexaceae bacterium]